MKKSWLKTERKDPLHPLGWLNHPRPHVDDEGMQKLIDLGINVDWMFMCPHSYELMLIVPSIIPDIANKPRFTIQKTNSENDASDGLPLFYVGYYISEENKWFYQETDEFLVDALFRLVCWCAEKGYIHERFYYYKEK